MIVPVAFLKIMVVGALAVTLLAPFVLLILWVRDWRAGRLW